MNYPRYLLNNVFRFNKLPARYKSQRFNLGKAPGIARTLAQRLEEMDAKDPRVYYKVNIGFSKNKLSRRAMLDYKLKQIKNNKCNSALEYSARTNTLTLPLEDVEHDWSSEDGPEHIREAAEHYGIFEDLFVDGYFLPLIHLDICYKFNEREYPIYRGNHMKPEMVLSYPQVSYKTSSDSLWTLLMTTPDGHLEGEGKEYVHWLVGNIRGTDLTSGETVFDYLQPCPFKGLGHLRYVFILFKQVEPLDFSSLKENLSGDILSSRNFSTYNFYRERESHMTPTGLAWFQADWDVTVTDFILEKLAYDEEPVFMYNFPEPYHPKQQWFPKGKAFNLYLDRYRDEKDIAKEYLVTKLRNHHPFSRSSSTKTFLFPNAIPFKKNTPSWLKNELRKRRLGQARMHDYK